MVQFVRVYNGQKVIKPGDIKTLPDDKQLKKLFGPKSKKDSTAKDPRVIILEPQHLDIIERDGEISVEAIGYIDTKNSKKLAKEFVKLREELKAQSNDNENAQSEIARLRALLESNGVSDEDAFKSEQEEPQTEEVKKPTAAAEAKAKLEELKKKNSK